MSIVTIYFKSEINKGDQPKIPTVIEKSEKSQPVRRSRTPLRRAKLGGKFFRVFKGISR